MNHNSTISGQSDKRIMAASASVWQRLLAMLAQRCPRCLRGPVFAGLTTMHEHCPVCGLQFERERGYFIGSMYLSYTISMILILLPMLVIYILCPELDLGWIVLIASALYLPFVPVAWRYSRILWMYLDRWAWPENLNARTTTTE